MSTQFVDTLNLAPTPPGLLSDLPDGLGFERRLVEGMIAAHRGGTVLAVLLVSVDRYGAVNAALGHGFGDLLLREVAYRIGKALLPEDACGFMGGGDFALMLSGIGDAGDDALEAARRAHERAGRVLQTISGAFAFSGHEIYLNPSAGLCLFPHNGASAHALLKNVSVAAARAREMGGNRCLFYTEEIDDASRQLLLLEAGLRRALANQELTLHYQPKVSAADERVIGAEALVRWQHPERGLLAPSDFIPFAEASGLIVPLSEWVVRTACAQMKQWLDEGFSPARVSVNLSPRHFQQAEVSELVSGILDSTGLPPHLLEIEVTEGSIMTDAARASRKLRELKERGVSVSVDDFGTGYSSLGYLKALPIDALKIDRSFVRDMTTDGDDAAIVSAIIGLAHNLRLKVVAEGVETRAQAALLREMGCDELQGFLFDRPLPPEEFRRLLVRR